MGKLSMESALMLLRFVSSVTTASSPPSAVLLRGEFERFQCQISPPPFRLGSLNVKYIQIKNGVIVVSLAGFGACSPCLCCVNTS